jgi:phage shock protein PspC (stress-responsive transcriptional regulator)
MAEEPRKPDPDETGPTEPMTSGDPLGAAGEAPPPPAGGAPPPPGGRPRVLTRSTSDKVIGGVAGGLGRYFGVDPILFRIAFVVLAFAGGIGVLAYLGLLAFVPGDDDSRPFGDGRTGNIVGAVLLGLAAVVLFGGPAFFLAPALVPIALVVLVGLLLWRAAGGAPAGSDPARVIARAALAFLIGLAAIGAFLGVGAAAALGGGTVIAALAVAAGVGLVAAAFVGGARWLIVPALVLVLPLAVVAAADIEIDGGVGSREYRPGTVAELRDEYRLGMGDLLVDMRAVDLPAGRTSVALDVGIGEATLLVPRDACVSSDVDIGIGHADVLDRDSDGVDVAFAETARPPAGAPEVHVDAEVGVGAVGVWREGDLGSFDFGRDDGFRFGRNDELDVEPTACP